MAGYHFINRMMLFQGIIVQEDNIKKNLLTYFRNFWKIHFSEQWTMQLASLSLHSTLDLSRFTQRTDHLQDSSQISPHSTCPTNVVSIAQPLPNPIQTPAPYLLPVKKSPKTDLRPHRYLLSFSSPLQDATKTLSRWQSSLLQ